MKKQAFFKLMVAKVGGLDLIQGEKLWERKKPESAL